ncbi:MAG TPA: DNA-binding domain-containing protein, partial [Candidatus Paceibacterota bacterium]|nr:DNA-binding domain-containing protein [Candidatus Paceibacterota bacterium]
MKTSKPDRQTKGEFHALQKLMASAVMRPLARDDSMQRKWIDGRPTKKIAESFIKPNDRLTSFERLEIYNRQYWFRVRNCFYEDYPGLRAILGDKKFARLADAYLEKFPSRSYTLRNLGSRLVKFLEANPKLTAPHRLLALDMARLEWAHTDAFDNEAETPLKHDDLAGLDAAKIRLQLQPHLTLLKLENEIDDFLIELKKNSGLRSEASNAMEQNHRHKKTRVACGLKRKTNFLAVHRFQDLVYYKRLEPGQFRLLSALQSGATLEKACAELAG